MCFSRPTFPLEQHFSWLCSGLTILGISKGCRSCCLSSISTAPNSYKWEENTTKQRQGEIPGLLKADPPLLCFPGEPQIHHALHTPPALSARLDFSGRKGCGLIAVPGRRVAGGCEEEVESR